MSKTEKQFDWVSTFLTLVLLMLGCAALYSATYNSHAALSPRFVKQVYGALGGLVLYVIATRIDVAQLARIGFLGFIATIILLASTALVGSIGMGGQRWLSIGFLRAQPSELAKLFVGPFIAYYYYEYYLAHRPPLRMHLRSCWPAILIVGLASMLIIRQPDLGTGLIVLASMLVILWIGGMARSVFIAGCIGTLLLAPLMWKNLYPYQQRRILVLLGYGDKHRERYHIEQAMIAIGAGGLCGSGPLQGAITKLDYVPEEQTDFIFAVLCEECGFVGALCMLLLFVTLFVRIGIRLLRVDSVLQRVTGFGLLIPIVIAVIVNTGMVTGLLPIVGIPLPLFSYGLSNLWVTLTALGWINAITSQTTRSPS